jgi:hypothetical protein
MPALAGFDPWAAIGKVNPAVAAETERIERDADEAFAREERLAIQNEPRLPPPGSPARLALDRAHARMVAGLLAGARAPIPSPSPN